MKKVPVKVILDKIHRGFVYTCMGISLTGITYIGLVGWNYYYNIKPKRISDELRRQQELLQEGTGIIETKDIKS